MMRPPVRSAIVSAITVAVAQPITVVVSFVVWYMVSPSDTEAIQTRRGKRQSGRPLRKTAHNLFHALSAERGSVGHLTNRFVMDREHGLITLSLQVQKRFAQKVASRSLGNVFTVMNNHRAFFAEDDEAVAGAAVGEVVNRLDTSGLANSCPLGTPCAKR